MLERLELKNRYYLIRHGNSKANREEVIVSSPGVGIKSFGLSEYGCKQVLQLSQKIEPLNYKVLSSPFKRAVETAEILTKNLQIDSFTVMDDLKERYFGDFDLTSSSNYDIVWLLDSRDPDHNMWFVESVNDVYKRVKGAVEELEESFDDEDIILVSHGDTLQILECWFRGIDPSQHRSLDSIEQAEMRKMKHIRSKKIYS